MSAVLDTHGHADHGYHPGGIMRWITTTNHKDIGTLYLWFSFIMFMVGGVMALGCTIGQGITGMSTLALGSMLAWLSILGGGYFGLKYLEEGSFGSAIRAVLARG